MERHKHGVHAPPLHARLNQPAAKFILGGDQDVWTRSPVDTPRRAHQSCLGSATEFLGSESFFGACICMSSDTHLVTAILTWNLVGLSR